jgi:PAS domain S-box-containing protein
MNDLDPIEALAFSEAKLAAIISLSDDAILTVDRQQRITMFNHGAERIFGYTAEEALGRSIEMLIPERLREVHRRHVLDFVQSGDEVRQMSLSGPITAVRKNGEEFPAESSVAKFVVGGEQVLTVRLRDVSQRVSALRELASSQARMAGIINLSDDAIITVDEEQRITLFNPAAERIFGYAAGEVMGRHIAMLIPERLRAAHATHVAGFIGSGDDVRQMSLSGPIMALRKSGEEFPAESAVSKFTIAGEQVLTVRLRDVSDKVKAEELRVQLRAAEESARMKMQLVSTVSHELRTPLAAVRGFVSTLIEYGDRLSEAEKLNYLRIIEDSTVHLENMVSDLLTLSRLEAGVIQLQKEPLSLHSLIDAVVASYQTAALTHRFKLPRHSRIVFVEGDRQRLRQVLTNLVDNAMKYSDVGTEIEIDARIGRSRWAEIIVRDHGKGVPADKLEAIFDAFYRAPGERERTKGAGLGLAICRGIVEAHGGSIRAELPARGSGLLVRVLLPGAWTQGSTGSAA